MRRALPTVILTACLLPMASASVQICAAADSKADGSGIKRVKLETGARPLKVKTAYSATQVPAHSTPSPGIDRATVKQARTEEDESWKSHGMFLATLLVMGAIALRRYGSGRP